MTENQRRLLLRRLNVIAVVNFIAFVLIALYIGGDAINGKIVNGLYFLSNKGRLTEVSHLMFEYSTWHTISVIATTGIAVVANVILRHKSAGRWNAAGSTFGASLQANAVYCTWKKAVNTRTVA